MESNNTISIFKEGSSEVKNEDCDKYCFLHEVKTFNETKKAVQVACGDSYTLVLTDHGNVYAFGKNTHYRLGIKGKNSSRVVFEPKLIDNLAS
jgi:alpha-tubulin suppressor-like RCC1 family protein